MEDKICQSCGMAMSEKDDTVGTNFDGTMSSEYCSYCYNLGEFLVDTTLEELIEESIPLLMSDDNNWDEEEAREYMYNHLSKLRRWRKKETVLEMENN